MDNNNIESEQEEGTEFEFCLRWWMRIKMFLGGAITSPPTSQDLSLIWSSQLSILWLETYPLPHLQEVSKRLE